MDIISAEYGTPGQPEYRRVQIDLRTGVVTFYRCHIPNRFLVFGPETEYSCPIDELRGLFSVWHQGIGQVCEVATPAGRARLPEAMTGDPVLGVIKKDIDRTGRRLRWYQHPAAKIPLGLAVVVFGTVGGIWLFLTQAIPPWVFTAGLIIAMCSVFAAVFVAWWRGRSLW